MVKVRSARAPAAVAAAVAHAAALVGCASGQAVARSAAAHAVTVPEPSALTASGSGGDYEVFTNTSEILPWSDLVITGTIAGFSQGSYVAPSNGVTVKPVIARVENVVVRDGDLPEQSDGAVYVSLIAPAGVDAVRSSLPTGTPVALYGWQINTPDRLGSDLVVEGIPAGQPLYGSAHPAGLVLQLGAPDEPILVWPELSGVARGLTLEAVLPGQDLGMITEDWDAYSEAFARAR